MSLKNAEDTKVSRLMGPSTFESGPILSAFWNLTPSFARPAETLARDWRKAAVFYARFGITVGQLRTGVPATSLEDADHETDRQTLPEPEE